MDDLGIREQLETEFKSKNVSVTLFPESGAVKFDDIQHFYDFISKERNFWSFAENGQSHQIKKHFTAIFDKLTRALNNTTSIDTAKNELNDAISFARQNQFPAVYSVTVKANLIKDLYQRHSEQADAACKYLRGEPLHSHLGSNPNSLAGYVFAILQDSGDAFSERISSEEEALADLRARYIQELNDLHAAYQEKHVESLDSHSTMVANYATFTNEIEKWRTSEQDKLTSFIAEKQEKFLDLEKTYADKLRLKAPAKYWDESSSEYKGIGRKWKAWAIVSAAMLILLLTVILYNLPNELALDKLSPGSIRGTIILAVIISIGIYIVRLFVKLSMSAYHLSRDADERKQLAYLYLSLLHEQGVTDADRAIVLQALFSRADTGLLKGDSGPTMPGPLGDFTKNIGMH